MKNFIRKNRALTAYVIISLIVGITGIATAPGNELLYMLLAQYIILPVAGFICSISAVKKGGVLGFISPVLFTLIATVIPLAVMKTTDIAFVLFAGIPCAIGFVFGLISYIACKAKKDSADEKKEAKEEKKLDKEEAKAEKDEFSVENDDANSSEANVPEEPEDEEPAVLIAD